MLRKETENRKIPMRNNFKNKNVFIRRLQNGLRVLKCDADRASGVTRTVASVVLLVGILSLLLFIVQSIRLSSANKKIRAAEAMSKELQEQLEEQKGIQGNNTSDTQPTPQPQATLMPTPTPEPIPVIEDETGKKNYYLVCLDAGHGGKDGGAVLRENGEDTRIESVDNLAFAHLLREALEKHGIRVVMTREDDTFLELGERTYIANSAGADLMISSHRNSYYEEEGKGNESARGVEIWLHGSRPADMTELASEMLSSIEPMITKNRGVKYGTMEDSTVNYAINKYSKMGSMIIELGFVTSYTDNDNLDQHGAEYAEAFAGVIEKWLKEHVALEE